MTVTEEFEVKNAAGHALILQNLKKGISYLDYGKTKLGRDFEGYRVKYTDRTAQKQADGTFKITESDDVFSVSK
tara:strand:- start:259894 stop:260115 length:222 start_codon:yes stop_codon:yes gene_type:complete